MPAYRTVETSFIQPTSQIVPGSPAQGERVNTEGLQVLRRRGTLRPLPVHLVISSLGQAGREYFRWRGRLPYDVRPEAGWELRTKGSTYRVVSVREGLGGAWTLDVERI
jgi:hypothetical protein